MSALCEPGSLSLLRQMIGKRLLQIRARIYPGYLAYSEVIADFEGLGPILINLKEVAIASKFDVFVINISSGTGCEFDSGWDVFNFGDFSVSTIDLLRREEWVDLFPMSEEFTCLEASHEKERPGVSRQSELTDVGICLESSRGAKLKIVADTFPLVLQLEYAVASTPLMLPATVPLFV